MYLIIYVLFFAIWLIVNYKKYGFNISSFLICLYLVSSITSLVLLFYYKEFDENRILISAIIYHIICFILFLSPIINYGNKININNINIPPYNYMKYFYYFIIVLGICCLIYNIPRVIYSFSFENLTEARYLHNKRELFNDEDKGLLGYLGSLGTFMSFYTLFYFFYLLTYYKEKKIVIILLLISSFSIVISNLAIMGRDGAIRWILFFISYYLLYRKYLNKKLKRNIKIIFLIPFVLIIIFFLMISLSRFGERGNGVVYYLYSYLGQQNIFFSYNFEKFIDGIGGGRMNFPYLFADEVSVNNLNEIVYADYNLNTFSTFIGSFYIDLGLFKTFVLGLLFYLLNTIIFRKITFINTIYFLITYEITILGIFYYMFYGRTIVNTLIMLLGLSIIINIIFLVKSNYIKIK